MAKLMYCITCEKEVLVEEPIQGHSVVEFVPDKGRQEIFWCEGEFTESAPVEVPDWEIGLVEPTDDELNEMNLNAGLLLQDLGVL